MSLRAIVTRIRTECPFFERRVGASSELEESTQPGFDLQVPHAFVVPLYDQPEPKGNDDDSYQLSREFFSVIVCVDNQIQGGRGAKSNTAMSSIEAVEQARTELAAALLNWTPDNARTTAQYEQGFHMAMDNVRLWHAFHFSFGIYVKSEGPACVGVDVDPGTVDSLKTRTQGPDGEICRDQNPQEETQWPCDHVTTIPTDSPEGFHHGVEFPDQPDE